MHVDLLKFLMLVSNKKKVLSLYQKVLLQSFKTWIMHIGSHIYYFSTINSVWWIALPTFGQLGSGVNLRYKIMNMYRVVRNQFITNVESTY